MFENVQRPIVLKALRTHATGKEKAMTPQRLKELEPELTRFDKNYVSTELSHCHTSVTYKNFVRRLEISPRRYAYYFDLNNRPAESFDDGEGKTTIEVFAPLTRKPRKVARRGRTTLATERPYKLEVSGDDVLLSTNISSSELAAIMAAVLSKRG